MKAEQLYSKAEKLRLDYEHALVQIPEFTEACAKTLFGSTDKDVVNFDVNGTQIEVSVRDTSVSNMLQVDTTSADFYTSVLVYSNIGPLNGSPSKKGMFEIRRTALRPMRKASLEKKEIEAKGKDAIRPIRKNIQDIVWIALEDYSNK